LHPHSHAQSTGGSLSGTVKDGTGGVLPGVTITISNTDTSLTRTVVTDARGHYIASDLPPGPYSVKGTLEGFNAALRTGITMSVGRDAVLDLDMNLGKLSDEVIVVAEAKTVDTQTASTGGLISTGQIEGLPLNGRSFVELANPDARRPAGADRRPEHQHRPRREAERQRLALHRQPVHGWTAPT
jgi:hypothetical protein